MDKAMAYDLLEVEKTWKKERDEPSEYIWNDHFVYRVELEKKTKRAEVLLSGNA